MFGRRIWHLPGLKPRLVKFVNVWANARTYLSCKCNGKSKNKCKSKNKSRSLRDDKQKTATTTIHFTESAYRLEDSGGAHASSYAHGDHSVAGFAAGHLA